MKTIPHHPDDIRDMRSCVLAVLEDQFGDDEVTTRRLDWLDTDEGKNHRHILGLWDANEDADYYDELATRIPDIMAQYLESERDQYPHEDETKARAAYMYGFDLFDDVVEMIRAEVGG